MKSARFEGNVLSVEQVEALKAASEGCDLVINSVPGSGKTYILKAISYLFKQQNQHGLYASYSRELVRKSQRYFPLNIKCRTFHSIAYQKLGYRFRHNLHSELTANLVSNYLFGSKKDHLGIASFFYCELLIQLINAFCLSDDSDINRDLLSSIDLLCIDPVIKEFIEDDLIEHSRMLWEQLSNPKQSKLPINPDVFLKLFCISEDTSIKSSFFLFDEIQDISPCLLGFIAAQTGVKCFAGDEHQNIFSFKGTIRSLDSIKTNTTTSISMNKSYRFGNEIANYVNKLCVSYKKSNPTIKGADDIQSRVVYNVGEHINHDIIICRTNLGVINALFENLSSGLKKICVLADLSTLISDLTQLKKIIIGEEPTVAFFKNFKTIKDVKTYVERYQSTRLQSLMQMLKRYDCSLLISILSEARKVREKEADLVISNVHQIKGREFNSVVLYDDFRTINHIKFDKDEDPSLLYVACTRARYILDISRCTAAKILPTNQC